VFRLAATVAAVSCLTLAPAGAHSQEPVSTGSVAGRVTNNQGAPLAGAQVIVDGTTVGAVTRDSGQYVIARVPVGSRTLRVRLVGYSPRTATVTIAADQRSTQDFTLVADPLSLASVVVTGTADAAREPGGQRAISTLTPDADRAVCSPQLDRDAPLRSRIHARGELGGEVNQNISVRGVLGVEYVMFMEDGMPVFPTMHTFFMNADNLFRPDENIDQVEVVRGGSSALFGSNTPGAIVNIINKTGGPELHGTLRASAGERGFAR
jgi:outer membrane receptor protein involved in Fe transport